MASAYAVCNVATCRKPAAEVKAGLNRCAGCHAVFYCNGDHQKADWAAHKTLCKQLKLIAAKDLGFAKTTLVEGKGTEKPAVGSTVTVHYEGSLPNGIVFDKSKKDDKSPPFQFILGVGQVIKGWDEGIATLSKGEKARLVISSDYAYGDSGRPPRIPPKSQLIFDVELLDWTTPAAATAAAKK